MPFDLSDTQFTGPALPEPFVKFELENELTKLKLLPKTTGSDGKLLKEEWEAYRRHLSQLAVRGGPLRVRNQAIEPLCKQLGYTGEIESAPDVETREGREDGGYLLKSPAGAKLRVWTTDLDEDIDAPAKRGQAYRFSHLRIAQRVLLASGERVGLLTNGIELRLLISDPARPDSQVIFTLDPDWKRSREVPDSFRLLLALVCPAGVEKIPELVDKARLQQARVTKDLRDQARQAVQRFVQEVLDHPDNREWLSGQENRAALARNLWHEGLIIVYRLLFVLKLESSDDPARSFTFASTSLWRNTFSPSMALARYVQGVLFDGAETGGLLEAGLRGLFRMFHEGVECTELNVKPLGGALFGAEATPVLSKLRWGERAVAHLLDQLLWTTPKKKGGTRERVHYGPLDVEDLGRVYEALLELEPGIASEPMCRLRRQKLEVVVPMAQGEKYRPTSPLPMGEGQGEGDEADENEEEEEENEDDAPKKGKKTTVQWIEQIQPGKFYLRVGLGRKSTGSYYTPHSFVRFLVQETLGPQVAERSPPDDPQPGEIIKLKVCDPACGSGHFLVESCRFLGQSLYEAVRLCDETATAAERRAETAKRKEDRETALAEAKKYRQRVIDLPDPDGELLRYLPSRSVEGEQTGVSQRRAEAICRRMVAVHCLYAVDKNPLAVELAKLALWLESHAEGMPLTFLDHRIVVGDSLTGPFWEQMLSWPSKPKEKLKEGLYHHLETHLRSALFDALRHVRRLEATVGVSLAEVNDKAQAKAELDEALLPFRIAAAAWSGGVMLGPEHCDDVAYIEMMEHIGTTHELPDLIQSEALCGMIASGLGLAIPPGEDHSEGGLRSSDLYSTLTSGRCAPAVSFDLTFPEVFYPSGVPYSRQGFDTVLGNPPWDALQPLAKEFFAAFDFTIMEAPTRRERNATEERLLEDNSVRDAFDVYVAGIERYKAYVSSTLPHVCKKANGQNSGAVTDLWQCFAERSTQLVRKHGSIGIVIPSAFHANESATGIRELYVDEMQLRCCYSFENRRALFEIHRSFKFDLVVAIAGATTASFLCAFYLHDDEWLFARRSGSESLSYSREFVRRTGGDYLSLLELQSNDDFEIAELCFGSGERFGDFTQRMKVQMRQELHMAKDAWRFTPTGQQLPNDEDPRDPEIAERLLRNGFLALHEGKTFWHYDDRWEQRPRYVVSVANLVDRTVWLRAISYMRLSFRDISGSTNERTVVFAFLPAGCRAETARCEASPEQRPDSTALTLLSMVNSYPFDYIGRLMITGHVQFFILYRLPLPRCCGADTPFLAHNALRLTCNHSGYAPLWREQVGDLWREEGKPPMTWPVLAGDDERWVVRAAIDAVVADAYGLSRDQYAHVLSTFSHASYRKAPELCLARFDELKGLGLEKFIRKYDPYWDIPLNENLPQPVIELPIPGEIKEGNDGEYQLAGEAKPQKRGRGRGNKRPSR